jgi:ATP-dependent helicase/nuclease subunit A
MTQADAARLQKMAEEEYRRLLYVAMTRAADRLIVCGYRGVRANSDTWHMMISSAMADSHPHVTPATFEGPDGEWQGVKWRVPQVGRTFERSEKLDDRNEREALPSSILGPLPPQRQLPRPLSPSGAGTIIDEEADDLLINSPLFTEKTRSDRSLEKGRLIHRMLQTLPDFAPAERADAAARYASRAARFWPETERQRLIDSVLKLLAEDSLQAIFAGHTQPEVSIMGTLTLKGGHYAVSGRVDRLAVFDDHVVALDYKTNRVPPATQKDIPFAHQAQLAIYREILAPLYPGKHIDCVLVYTENATVYTLSERELEMALAGLKTK